MRSNSREAGFGLIPGSFAFSHAAVARRTVAQSEVIVVFIGFRFVVVRTFINTTNGKGRGGHWFFSGGKDVRAF